MSLELLIVICVAVFVFGPQKLPMLAKHMAALFIAIQRYRQKWQVLQDYVSKEVTLQAREEQAREVDEQYQKKTSHSTMP